ncbi:hypothetical protein ACWCQL_38470 [Streptomyces sp. NPDC002073]
MDPVELACLVVPFTALLFACGGPRARREGRRRRPWAGLWPARAVDPYHAAVVRWYGEDDIQAAAARLVLDGLVTVNHRGTLTLTPVGADPARSAGHPLPDALLAALRRRTAPATLGNITLRDTELGVVRAQFHADVRRSPAVVARPEVLIAVAMWLLLAEFVAASLALIGTAPQGAGEGAAATATWCALVAQVVWFGRYGRRRGAAGRIAPYTARLERAPRHPALVELARRDGEAVTRLRVSRVRTRRTRNRGRRRNRNNPPRVRR